MSAAPTTQDLATRCYHHICQGIIERRFLPGQTLSPAEIAAEVGVSRTPVTDALQRLEMEGLVEIHPRRGTVVTRVTTQGIQEIADARIMIEVHSAPAAIANATPEALAHIDALVDQMDRVLSADDEHLTHADWYGANNEFHRFIVELAGNEQILKIYDRLNLDVRLMRAVVGWGLAPYRPKMEHSQRHHRHMAAAIQRGDVAELQAITREHVLDGTERALATLKLVGGVL